MGCCNLSCDMSGPEWAFRSLTRAHHMASLAVFDKMGLRDVGQPVILFVLNDFRAQGEKCSQKRLCEILNLSPSTVAISIKSLEKHGYVAKKEDDADRRRNIVEITPEGVDVAEKCRCGFDDIDKAMYSGFSEEEKQQMTLYFTRACENLRSLAKSDGCEGRKNT